jgi:outer membrane protein assembly factor BamE (lipoprotein component of BamABCDE complex)
MPAKWSLLFISLFAVLGCSHVKGSFNPQEGRDFNTSNLERIHKGTTSADVINLVGEPLERIPEETGERWHYYVRESRTDRAMLFGITLSERRWERRTEANLLVVKSAVANISYDSKITPPP